jgi:hypothetical protein
MGFWTLGFARVHALDAVFSSLGIAESMVGAFLSTLGTTAKQFSGQLCSCADHVRLSRTRVRLGLWYSSTNRKNTSLVFIA